MELEKLYKGVRIANNLGKCIKKVLITEMKITFQRKMTVIAG